jgi:hypothetical protein
VSSARRHQRPAREILSSYDVRVLADNPVFFLLLSGASAGAADRTGNGHTAQFIGAPPITSFPNGDNATVLDGATQYLEITNDGTLSVANTGILSIEAWMRPDVLEFAHTEGSGYVHWLGKNTSGESEYAARIYSFTNQENRPNRISGYSFNLSGGLGAGSYFQDTVVTGQWIHYVLVINSVNTSAAYPTGYTKLYKNGVQRDQDSLSDYSITPAHGTAPLRIGTTSLDSFFQGAIAKVAVYGYEISPFAVRDHYQIIVPPISGSSAFIKNVGTASTKVSGTTLAVAVPAGGVSAGSTLIVKVAHDYTSGGPTMADSRGNVYTRDQTSPNGATTMRASLFSAQINNALREGDTILLTTSAVTTVRAMSVDEFTRLTFSSPLDVKNSTSATSTTPGGTIPITTTNADDLLVGMVAVLGPSDETYTEDTLAQWSSLARVGSTGGAATSNTTVNSAYRVVGSTGTYRYQPTLGTSESWIEIIASYKAGTPTIVPTPGGSVNFIQNIGSASSKTTGNTLVITVPFGGVPVGHTLIVRLLHDYTSGGPTTSDSRGNVYTRDRTATNAGTTMRMSVFSATIATALQAGDSITISLSASVTARAAVVDEFAGVAAPIVIDAQNGLGGTSATPSLPNTTVNADDLIVAMVGVEGPTDDSYTDDTIRQWSGLARSGTTGGISTSNKTINGAYHAVGAAGTYTYAPTLGASANWLEFSMAYKAGAAVITPPPSGTAAFIKNIGTANSSVMGNTLTLTVPAGGVASGNTLVVRVLHDYTAGAPTITDSRGNTYTRDRTAADSATLMRASLFSCPISTALQAADSITITLSTSVAVRTVAADEFSNVLTPVVVDAQDGASSTSTSPNVPLTTTNANDLLIGFVAVAGDSNDSYTEDSANLWAGLARAGTTGGTPSNNRTINTAYRSVGTSTTYHYAPTLGTSSLWIEFVIAYKAV